MSFQNSGKAACRNRANHRTSVSEHSTGDVNLALLVYVLRQRYAPSARQRAME
jgi:hypothetical protein